MYHDPPHQRAVMYSDPPHQHVAMYHGPPHQRAAMYSDPPQQHVAMYHGPPHQRAAMYSDPPQQHVAMYHGPPQQRAAPYHDIEPDLELRVSPPGEEVTRKRKRLVMCSNDPLQSFDMTCKEAEANQKKKKRTARMSLGGRAVANLYFEEPFKIAPVEGSDMFVSPTRFHGFTVSRFQGFTVSRSNINAGNR